MSNLQLTPKYSNGTIWLYLIVDFVRVFLILKRWILYFFHNRIDKNGEAVYYCPSNFCFVPEAVKAHFADNFPANWNVANN